MNTTTSIHTDVLIIGAGISGIGLAAHLRQKCPDRQIKILERREHIGGTWDLFQYPGIRSDSDMSTFGFNFKPWRQSKVLADGASIVQYLQETVAEYDLEPLISFGQNVLQAHYDSSRRLWTVTVEDTHRQTQQHYETEFLAYCTGYYNYDAGFMPNYPEQEQFKGRLIHPQHWPKDLDYQGQRIVVIGSGATAITLVPSLIQGGAAHVTMLQRSPTYVASIASVDRIHQHLRRWLPEQTAYQITRAKNIAIQRGSYLLSQRFPKLMRFALLKSVQAQLGQQIDIKHFSPHYQPWDQRLCVVPDGDLFKVLKSGQASVETDQIEAFVEQGIRLQSGKVLPADIIVSATGLNLQMFGGMQVQCDQQPFVAAEHALYNAVLPSHLPNCAILMGYTNASWTLKVDLAADYLCRLLNYMQQQGYDEVVASSPNTTWSDDTIMGSLHSGYVRRAADVMLRQGRSAPWIVTHNYLKDRKMFKAQDFKDPILQFSKPRGSADTPEIASSREI